MSTNNLIKIGFSLSVLRLLFHAFFLPAFEGPDEPFHLARVRAVLDPKTEVSTVDPELVASIRSVPCGPDLQRAVGCRAFGAQPAAFNLLKAPPNPVPGGAVDNYQAHQPPLYYWLGALALLVVPSPSVFGQLLALRLVALILVVAGLELCRRSLPEAAFSALLASLWLPGAAESLIRAANEPLVFFFAAFWLWAMMRQRSPLVALALLGATFTKLTAAPLVGFSVVQAVCRKRWGRATLYAVCGSCVVVVQWFRGWAWGGTLEVAAEPTVIEPLGVVVVGVAHSAYTFVKTAVWLGGWAVFRPPWWVVVVSFALLAAWLMRCRIEWSPTDRPAHLAAFGVAVVGFIAFAIGKRHLFGVWGAVGGWYFWSWLPWVAWSATQWLRLRDGRWRRLLLIATTVFLGAVQIAWLVAALTTYGL